MSSLNQEWILAVQIDGEWEHCGFEDRSQAIAAFQALSIDYVHNIQRALLMSKGVETVASRSETPSLMIQ